MRAAIIISVILTAFAAKGADNDNTLRPVAAAYTFEVGSSHLCDTYLTPLKYSGQSYAISYERMQAMKFAPEDRVMRLETRLGLNRGENPARNATMWDLDLEFGWGMMRRFEIENVAGLKIYGGGSTTLDAGAMYLARNGNNPVAAKAAWTLNLTGAAVYNFIIRRLSVCLRYQPTLPVTGVFFSPDYGELYYEIYIGNHKGLVHGAWWGNYFRLDNLLTADLRFGSTNLRIGYRADFFSSKVNDIVTRRVTHSFVIGVSGEWLSLPRTGRIGRDSKIISALY